jgi:hypothetical protein
MPIELAFEFYIPWQHRISLSSEDAVHPTVR